MTDQEFLEIKKIANDIMERTTYQPEIAMVLGSGLGPLSDEIENKETIMYKDIEGFLRPSVLGHVGRITFGQLCGKTVVAFEGREHYYECNDMSRATLMIRVIKMMGIDKLILTNAAGGIRDDLNQGDLMMIRDHISSFVPSPLIGKNIDELGERFPDMTHIYDYDVIRKVHANVRVHGIDIKTGVYLQTTGPNYETPAEIRMYAMLGADAVGMSTVCESMVARHMGMKVSAISCISNKAAGLVEGEIYHTEVQEAADSAYNKLRITMREIVSEM